MQERRCLPVHSRVASRGTGMPPLSFLPARILASVLASVLVLILASLSSGAFADQTYYRWKDERGNLVMSDRPPERPDISYETIGIRGSTMWPSRASSSPPAPLAVTPAPPTQQEREPAKDPTATVAAAERDPEACAQAQKNLQILNTKPRIRAYNEQGELEYLTPRQIEEEKRKSRLTIERHCDS